ncbi:MAG: DUF3857 domain-containing protein [Bacteroidetes bacterium]|nr:DUF3857 domain-containing protein [Bacteroidota bacterium]
MKYFFIVAFAVGYIIETLASPAQQGAYQWEENRKRYVLSDAEDSISEYILRHHIQYDYAVENDRLVLLNTVHRIVRVNSDEAIQRNNRIYISMNRSSTLIALRARTITKSGKVVYFDQKDLKEIAEEEKGTPYKIFAMEGVEQGSEVEYFYTRKMNASMFDRVYLQFEVPVKASSFQLSCPEHLEFDFRTYNGLPEISKRSEDKKNIYTVYQERIERRKKEEFSNYEASRKRVEFKWAYNNARSRARQYTWDEAAKTFYRITHTRSKEDEKALQKFAAAIPDNPKNDLSTRIAAIEKYIKSNIQIAEKGDSENLEEIAGITKYKNASESGITKLFLGVMEQKAIECQVVITCSREVVVFDPKFDSWAFLDQYLLYFPGTRGFLAPGSFQFRYPFVPAELTAQSALFVEPVEVGDLKSALPELKMVPAIDYTLNVDNLNIEVDFSTDLSANNIKLEREFGGYNASFIAPYFEMTTEEQRSNMVKEITKQTAPDADIAKWDMAVSKKSSNNVVMKTDFKSSHFIENAGKRILFKVGELIGPQTELYQDDKRTTPVENDFNRGYDRVIKVKLPEGYRVKNPDDCKIDIQYKEGDQVPFLFVSSYKQSGQELEIAIQEYYKTIHAPLARYEDFRKVINAAADFNKVVLVLEKQ